MTQLSTILSQVDQGVVLLPEFQRGYVWNRDQVRGLMRSLYRGYPVGTLLVWQTDRGGASVRGSAAGGEAVADGPVSLLLDGQQRITSLYGIVRGRPPAFFEGDPSAFTGLRFHVGDELFEFYAPAKMRDDPRWIDVTELFVHGPASQFEKLMGDGTEQFTIYAARLTQLYSLTARDFHQEVISGPDKTVDVVVDIFNKVNSAGTKLSKGDLALAKVCAEWGQARGEMRLVLDRWRDAGYRLSLDWLLRNVNAVATGRALFSALEGVPPDRFEQALRSATAYIGHFLDVVAARLGLDHDRVLMGRYAFPVVSRYLHLNGGKFTDATERDRMLYWYVHAALWGRFATSTETVLAQDYEALARDGIDGLIRNLRRWRGGDLTVDGADFEGFGRGSRFYPLLYLLTRVRGARDFGSGLELRREMLGKLASLQVHHIFPKALLYQAGYHRTEVNAVANFCFLSQQTNLEIGRRPPEEYFAEVQEKQPGALESQWIPTDPELWRVDRYRDFLAARRELLASAANGFLTELRDTVRQSTEPLDRLTVVSVEDPDDARAQQVAALVRELTAAGCAEPVSETEIADPATGRVLAVAEAFWPDGLQPGLGAPVMLELDHNPDLARLEELGYEVFTSVDALRGFVARRNLEAAGEETTAAPADQWPTGADGVDEAVDPAVRDAFERAMWRVYEEARQQAGYHATYFRGMLADHGGVGTAQRLLTSDVVSDGFIALWERGRLDLTVEALVSRPEFGSLFTADEVAVARHRLEQAGYQPD